MLVTGTIKKLSPAGRGVRVLVLGALAALLITKSGCVQPNDDFNDPSRTVRSTSSTGSQSASTTQADGRQRGSKLASSPGDQTGT